jgi:glycosyltransferase involved in cell wall biosynthesis
VSSSEEEVITTLPDEYVFGASRFVAYKQLEKVIAAGESANLPVVLAGGGPEEEFLRNIAHQASVPVYFVVSPSDSLLYALIQQARVFIFPPIEDFGILPVEAMALGTPVVVNATGGAVESVKLLEGGTAVMSFEGKEISDAIHAAVSKDMTHAKIHASAFSEESFSKNLREWMQI